jgi:biotin operon repressor
MRVWTAIRTLRRMGLAGILQSREGGYALDPAVPLEAG